MERFKNSLKHQTIRSKVVFSTNRLEEPYIDNKVTSFLKKAFKDDVFCPVHMPLTKSLTLFISSFFANSKPKAQNSSTIVYVVHEILKSCF